MAIDLIKQFEEAPEAYPAAPSGLSARAAALDANMIWARIEAYTAWRFTEREVIWTLIGDGGDQFNPRLTPVVSREGHVWRQEAWVPVSLLDGPLGIILPCDGTYKIMAQVGGGDVPAGVSEAFRRLAEYLADDPGTAGASSTAVAIGPIREELERNPNWVARAMQHSGAGDLLRPYRRA
ncbi:hypothetical protein T7987_15880 [Sulfitobacter faviae]|uniref:Uncharacterized protein n=1 Tax=Sulfitobacter faviae TaxID=1775881 RepID=A0ABZ0UYE1_9RHOB|nr:hypothetical protein [Sulfitobacter faviae]WPZ21622.1 hypothetical protein T7987_15880 [Sulfitobacter faviae]